MLAWSAFRLRWPSTFLTADFACYFCFLFHLNASLVLQLHLTSFKRFCRTERLNRLNSVSPFCYQFCLYWNFLFVQFHSIVIHAIYVTLERRQFIQLFEWYAFMLEFFFFNSKKYNLCKIRRKQKIKWKPLHFGVSVNSDIRRMSFVICRINTQFKKFSDDL